MKGTDSMQKSRLTKISDGGSFEALFESKK